MKSTCAVETCYVDGDDVRAQAGFTKASNQEIDTELSDSEMKQKRLHDYTVEEVGRWLFKLSLQQYVPTFAKQHIDGSMLLELDHEMLLELNMKSKIHRTRILKQILESKKSFDRTSLSYARNFQQSNGRNNASVSQMPKVSNYFLSDAKARRQRAMSDVGPRLGYEPSFAHNPATPNSFGLHGHHDSDYERQRTRSGCMSPTRRNAAGVCNQPFPVDSHSSSHGFSRFSDNSPNKSNENYANFIATNCSSPQSVKLAQSRHIEYDDCETRRSSCSDIPSPAVSVNSYHRDRRHENIHGNLSSRACSNCSTNRKPSSRYSPDPIGMLSPRSVAIGQGYHGNSPLGASHSTRKRLLHTNSLLPSLPQGGSASAVLHMDTTVSHSSKAGADKVDQYRRYARLKRFCELSGLEWRPETVQRIQEWNIRELFAMLTFTITLSTPKDNRILAEYNWLMQICAERLCGEGYFKVKDLIADVDQADFRRDLGNYGLEKKRLLNEVCGVLEELRTISTFVSSGLTICDTCPPFSDKRPMRRPPNMDGCGIWRGNDMPGKFEGRKNHLAEIPSVNHQHKQAQCYCSTPQIGRGKVENEIHDGNGYFTEEHPNQFVSSGNDAVKYPSQNVRHASSNQLAINLTQCSPRVFCETESPRNHACHLASSASSNSNDSANLTAFLPFPSFKHGESEPGVADRYEKAFRNSSQQGRNLSTGKNPSNGLFDSKRCKSTEKARMRSQIFMQYEKALRKSQLEVQDQQQDQHVHFLEQKAESNELAAHGSGHNVLKNPYIPRMSRKHSPCSDKTEECHNILRGSLALKQKAQADIYDSEGVESKCQPTSSVLRGLTVQTNAHVRSFPQTSKLPNFLDVDISAIDDEIDMQKSYKLMDDGALSYGDLVIGTGGVKGAPGMEALRRDALCDAEKILNRSEQNGTHINGYSEKNGLNEHEVNKRIKMHSGLRILGLLGKGAGGTVHAAVHVPSLRIVAVKNVVVNDKSQRKQMRCELDTLLDGLSHPNVIKFYDSFHSPKAGTTSLVFEYLHGGSLQQILDNGTPIHAEALGFIALDCIQGLEYLHSRKILHRDIKPSNLLVASNGRVKISDFGISREVDQDVLCSTYLGTFMYMSPERLQNNSYSFAADVWSLCLSLLTCALGKFPFQVTDGFWSMSQSITQQEIPSFPESFSKDFTTLIMKGLAYDPNERATLAEIVNSNYFKEKGESLLQSSTANPSNNALKDWYQRVVVEKQDIVSLKSIIDEVSAYYADLLSSSYSTASDILGGNDESIVSVKHDVVKLRALAEQLGLPHEKVISSMDNCLRVFDKTLQNENAHES